MSSVTLLWVICLIYLQFGLNSVTGQGFNLNGQNTMASRSAPQSRQSRSASLVDILLINSLTELDHDVEIEEPVFFNPRLTGRASSGTLPSSTLSKTPKKRKKKKSNNSYHNGGSASLASLFCAYCVQFGFNLCVSRYCFIDLF